MNDENGPVFGRNEEKLWNVYKQTVFSDDLNSNYWLPIFFQFYKFDFVTKKLQ